MKEDENMIKSASRYILVRNTFKQGEGNKEEDLKKRRMEDGIKPKDYDLFLVREVGKRVKKNKPLLWVKHILISI